MEPEKDWAEEENKIEIQDWLDEGYELLDRFVAWLETVLDIDTRTVQQDSFNAENLIDYLANHHHKGLDGANEFEIRWFLFSHYIRKSHGYPETQERLLQSLGRFYSFLRSARNFDVPEWLSRVLDEEGAYLRRLHDYRALESEDEAGWQFGFCMWGEEFADDLESRVLWLPRTVGNGLEWGDQMGWREATLHEEATQSWQNRRVELLEEGLNYDAIRIILTQEYLDWLNSPQERLESFTPAQVIIDEKENALTRDSDDDDEAE